MSGDPVSTNSKAGGGDSPRFQLESIPSHQLLITKMIQANTIQAEEQKSLLTTKPPQLSASPTFNKANGIIETLGSRTNVLKGGSPAGSVSIDFKYENITYCKELLQKGITARKYHYSKKGYAFIL